MRGIVIGVCWVMLVGTAAAQDEPGEKKKPAREGVAGTVHLNGLAHRKVTQTGALGADAVARGLHGSVARASHCAPRAGKPGTVYRVRLTVARDGALVSVKVKGPSAKAARCMKAALAAQRFDAAKGTTRIETEVVTTSGGFSQLTGTTGVGFAAPTGGIIPTSIVVLEPSPRTLRTKDIQRALSARGSHCTRPGHKVAVRIEIRPNGTVERVDYPGRPSPSAEEAHCIRKELATHRFPVARTRTVVKATWSSDADPTGQLAEPLKPVPYGRGATGFGPGGGGTGWGTIGSGRYGTIGHSGGTGTGYGVGVGRGGMRGRKARRPQMRIGQVTVVGDLDKNIIRRYIRRKRQVLRHCYETVLVKEPSIQGTVVVSFIIDGLGMVPRARATGIHPKVARCFARVVKTIRFPKPRGAGVVQVRYPFQLRPY